MAKPPTRPPATWSQGRPPRGPRPVPRTSQRAAALAALPDAEQAIAFLEAKGKTSMAAAVTTIAEFTRQVGEAQIRAAQRDAETMDPNFSIRMPVIVRDHLAKAAAKDGLTNVVTNALKHIAEGRFEPVKPQRNPFGAGLEMTALNVRASQELRDQAAGRLAEFGEQVTWTPRLSQAVLQWLVARYPLPEKKAGKK